MTAVSRRRLLQLAAAGVAATNGRVSAGALIPSLGVIAARNGYLFGAAAAEVIDTDAPYRELYVTHRIDGKGLSVMPGSDASSLAHGDLYQADLKVNGANPAEPGNGMITVKAQAAAE